MSELGIGSLLGFCALIVGGCIAWSRYNRRLENEEREKTVRQGTEALLRVVDSVNKKKLKEYKLFAVVSLIARAQSLR